MLSRAQPRSENIAAAIPGKPLAILVAMALVLISAGDRSTAEDTSLARERYVPADQLDVIFDRTPNGVMLPRAEFQSMLRKAQQARTKHTDIPTALAIRSANYAVRQLDNHAVVELKVEVEQFIEDWQTVNIPVRHLDLEEATIDGEPAAVGRHPQQPETVTLLHRDAGRFTLILKLSTPLGTVGSDRVAVFGILSDAATSLEITGNAEQYVEVNDLQLVRPAALDEAATYEVPIGSRPEVRIKWTSRRRQNDTASLVFARTAARVQLSVDTLRWISDTRLTVYGSPVNQVIASVPARFEINGVDSTGLESWNLEDDPERDGFTHLVLTYRQPFSNDRLVRVAAVSALETGKPAEIPMLQFVNLTAHSGRLHVSHEEQLRLQSETGAGIRELSVNELPADVGAASVFDFWLQDFRLSVAVRTRDRELFSQVNSFLNFADTLASLQVNLTVETLNEPLFEIELNLPENWQVQELVTADGQPIIWRTSGTAVDGSPQRIIVEPAAPVAVGQLLSITLHLRRSIPEPATPQSLPLPVVTAPATTLVAGSYRISSAADLEVAPVDIQGLVPIAGDGETLVFETQGTTFSGQLSIERRPARISSRAELRTWADDRQETTVAAVTVDVTNGTTRTLQLLLPEDAGADLRFDVTAIGAVAGVEEDYDGRPGPSGSRGGAGLFSLPSTQPGGAPVSQGRRTGIAPPRALAILEQSPAEPANGVRAYNLTFDRRFAGSVTLRTRIQNERTAGDPIVAPFVRVPNAVRQHGLLVLEASPEQRLAGAADAMTGLEQADAGLVDTPAAGTGRRVALVFRYVQPDYSLMINETRFDTQAVPTAVCEMIENVSLLSDTGSIQRAGKVHLRCVGIQTLRFTLPESGNTFLWSTVLNGEAIEVRRHGGDYLVAIPTDADNNEHTLEILFESSGDDVSGFGTTRQESVSLSIDTEQGAAQPIEILEQTWDVRYPQDSLLLDHDGGFHPLNGMDQPGWLQSIGSGFQLPTGRMLWQKLVPIVIFLLLLFVATVLMVRRRWKTIVAAGLGVFLFFLLILPTVQQLPDATRLSMANNEATMTWSEEGAGEEAPMDVAAPGVPSIEADDVRGSGFRVDSARQLQDGEQAGQAFGFERLTFPGSGGMGGMGAGGGLGGGGGFGGGADMFGGMLGVAQPAPATAEPATQPVTDFAAVDAAAPRKSGAARLSVRVDLQTPDDYRSTGFRSVGTTNGAGQLAVVVRNRQQLMAFRLLTTFVVLLTCWWLGRRSWVSRLAMIAVLSLLAVAVVPLLPNQWQAVADGFVLGAALSLALWLLFATCRCCESWLSRLKQEIPAGREERSADRARA